MKGPYQIRRERHHEFWRYKLYKFNKGRAVLELGRADISSSEPPKWLTEMQDKLNRITEEGINGSKITIRGGAGE